MKDFHAHIYFEPEHLETASLLAKQAKLARLFESVSFHKTTVGPHPTGMIEAQFHESQHRAALDWLNTHRGQLSVLVHEDTGNDLEDHTNGIQWLGKALPLDFRFFQSILEQPELRIHPEKHSQEDCARR